MKNIAVTAKALLSVWIVVAVWAVQQGTASEPGSPQRTPDAPTVEKLPYVYTQWRHFTVADGLPNDHIFAVKVDGPNVWIGTEDGLACYDKRTDKIRT